MTEPRIFAKKAMMKELEPGTYFWCACGRSTSQPFCDGSHKGTTISPVKFVVDAPQKMLLCLCKHTGTPPTCDGSHTKL